jgi:cation transport ATPase
MTASSAQRVTLPVTGLGCLGSGALIVERALLHVPGVIHAYVNAATEMAYVQFNTDRCTVTDLQEAAARAGFHAGAAITT